MRLAWSRRAGRSRGPWVSSWGWFFVPIRIKYRRTPPRGQGFFCEMVQNSPKRRGRPRAYDPDTALDRARDVFWDAGFAAASLDALAAATEMNRPSLYLAFGDKRALYRRTLDRYREFARAALAEALSPEGTLRDALATV